MLNFFKKKPKVNNEGYMVLVKFVGSIEYMTKEVCRARIKTLDIVDSVGHCTSDSETCDLLVFIKCLPEKIEEYVNMIRDMLPHGTLIDVVSLRKV